MERKQQTMKSRLPVLLGTMAAEFGLGSIYTWSLFNEPIAQSLKVPMSDVDATFSITSLCLALSTLFAGAIQKKAGIRRLGMLSGILLGAGLLLTARASSLAILYLTAGLLVGAADGIGYLAILSNCIQWFPEKRGLISGLSIGAYGIGSLVFKYVNEGMLESRGVSGAFLVWGIAAFVIVVAGAQPLKDAPEHTERSGALDGEENREFTRLQMLKTKEAYLLFVVLFTACMSGLYLIGVVSDLGQQLLGLSEETAAMAVTIVSLFNTAGRLVLGAVSDRTGRLPVVTGCLAVIAVLVLVLGFVPLNTGNQQLDFVVFLLCVGGVAACFGGIITVFPTIVGAFFGLNHQTTNYGIIYQGFGLGALAGTGIEVLTGGYATTFLVIAVLCVISILITRVLKKPQAFPPAES